MSSPDRIKNILVPRAGRPCWFDPKGVVGEAYIIGIAGGSASGKTRLASQIIAKLNAQWVLIVSQDSFYNPLTPEQSKRAFNSDWNFDSASSFDFELIRTVLSDLRASKAVRVPNYSFKLHQREKESTYLYGATIVIFEGIFALHDERTRDMMDLKLFVECDSDVMLVRRIRRDTLERGRDVASILDQYLRFVKPSYDSEVSPSRKYADLVVPGENNDVAISFISTTIKSELSKRAVAIRGKLFEDRISSRPSTPLASSTSWLENPVPSWLPLPKSLFVLDATPQVLGIHTIMRAETTSRVDFVFQADRLSSMIVEAALTLLPVPIFEEKIVGVSILRSGAALEHGLRKVISNIALGSVLIQNDAETAEPSLYHVELPTSLRRRETAQEAIVLLLDSQIGTGAAALMGIRILLDHGVKEKNIIFLTYLVSRIGGIHQVLANHPDIRIQTSAVDDGLEERTEIDPTTKKLRKQFFITPGLGGFGNRYYGD